MWRRIMWRWVAREARARRGRGIAIGWVVWGWIVAIAWWWVLPVWIIVWISSTWRRVCRIAISTTVIVVVVGCVGVGRRGGLLRGYGPWSGLSWRLPCRTAASIRHSTRSGKGSWICCYSCDLVGASQCDYSCNDSSILWMRWTVLFVVLMMMLALSLRYCCRTHVGHLSGSGQVAHGSKSSWKLKANGTKCR